MARESMVFTTKPKEEELPSKYPSVSAFEVVGLSPTEREQKKKEIFAEAGKDRAEFLTQVAESKWQKLRDYMVHSASNYLPAAGSAKILTEATIKKTSSGKVLDGKERVFHSIAGASGFMFYGAMGIDQLAETNLTKYGITISVASTLLTALASENGKSLMKKILDYSIRQAGVAKDALVAQSAEFFKAIDTAFDQMDLSRISELYRQDLILELQQKKQ